MANCSLPLTRKLRWGIALWALGALRICAQDATAPRPHTSTAAIQGLFQFNKDDMDGAINMAEGLIAQPLAAHSSDHQATGKSSP